MRAFLTTVAAGAAIGLASYVLHLYWLGALLLLVGCELAGLLLRPWPGVVAALLLSIPIWALPSDRSMEPIAQPGGCDPFCDTGQSAAVQFGSFGIGLSVAGALGARALARGMSWCHHRPRARR